MTKPTDQRLSDLEQTVSSIKHKIERLADSVAANERTEHSHGHQELLTVKQVQEILQISRGMVLKLRKDGRLPFITIGDAVRIPRTAIEAITLEGV